VKKHLEKIDIEVIARNFPDPELARAKFWLPFIEELGADENTILIGHSSGAVASLRYAENHAILGSVLVGVNYTDLNIPEEKASGYYDRPWKWANIKRHQNWIVQFSSTDDPFIPISEARFIYKQLDSDYHEFTDKEHFGYPNPMTEFPELIVALKSHLG
jgi:predicted alpha/beta hydrolase family esterase